MRSDSRPTSAMSSASFGPYADRSTGSRKRIRNFAGRYMRPCRLVGVRGSARLEGYVNDLGRGAAHVDGAPGLGLAAHERQRDRAKSGGDARGAEPAHDALAKHNFGAALAGLRQA